jgi:hypothetical protein
VLREAEAAPRAAAKQILYVLRTALTGVHALLERRIVTDVTALGEAHGFAAVRELVDVKRAGERVPLPADASGRWRAEIARAFVLLDEARGRSPLPEEAPNRGELEEWLVAVRLQRV